MSKYKIGDRVAFKGLSNRYGADTGTVTRTADEFGRAWAKWDNENGDELSFEESATCYSLIPPEEPKQDAQVIDGIEYPYVTVDGYPARIVCSNRKHDHYPVICFIRLNTSEEFDSLTHDLKQLNSDDEPYLRPYVKQEPKSIFDGLKKGTVVFWKYKNHDEWHPTIFWGMDKECIVDRNNGYFEFSTFEFRLDNPYLEGEEA